MAAGRQARHLKKLVRSLLLTLLGLAVLAALLWFGDARKVIALVGQFRPIYVVWFLLLLAAHEVIRGLLWCRLLQALTDRPPLRAQIFAFAAGEAAKFVPTGVYLQNFLLQRSTGADFRRSSAATTVMIVAEIVAAFIILVIFGIGFWSVWLRLSVIAVGILALYLLRIYLTAPHDRRTPRWVVRHRLLNWALDALRRFRAGAAALSEPRIVAITLALSVLYVFIAGAALYVVVLGLGIGGVSLWQAVAVSCFGLAFYVVLGSLEAADLGAFLSIGVSKSAAVSAILVYRALSLGATIALAVIVMATLTVTGTSLTARRLRKEEPMSAATGPRRNRSCAG
jgi:uncharacterized membrane protein YbhN (UPF0104 family)